MPTITGEPEVLGTDAPPSRVLPALGVLIVLALVASGVVWVEGERRGAAERGAIDACARAATTAVDSAERRLGAMASYVRPAFGTAPAEVDAGLMRLVAGQAPIASPAVDAALTTCREVDVWRFNSDHREARSAWIAFLVAEQRRLRAIAENGGSYFTGFEAVSARRQEAEQLWP